MVAIDYISRKCVRDGYRLIYTESLGELSEFEDNVGIMVSESGETQLVIDEAEKCRHTDILPLHSCAMKTAACGRWWTCQSSSPKRSGRMSCRLIRLCPIPSSHSNYCFLNYKFQPFIYETGWINGFFVPRII